MFKGFFVTDVRDGVDVTELQLRGTIAAGAAISLGVASAGVEGGITLTIDFNLNDPNMDGIVRLNELIGNALFDPRCIFDIHGRGDAFLEGLREDQSRLFQHYQDLPVGLREPLLL